MPKQSFYAVRVGRKAGVYHTWTDCEAQIKQYPNAAFKKFPSAAEAEAFVNGSLSPQPTSEITESAEDDHKGKKRTFSRVADEREWVVVYCDGACKGNGQSGSVAGIGVFWGPQDPRNIAERCPGDQTNNRAELIAIIRVLETAPVSKKLLIKTDSQYSINCFERWLPNWLENGFRTANGTPVKNAGIIRYPSALFRERGKRGQQVRLQYVKGHSGDSGNDGADALANVGTTLPPREELDWENLEAHASEITDALVPVIADSVTTADSNTVQALKSPDESESSAGRPRKMSRSSISTSTGPTISKTYVTSSKTPLRPRAAGPVSVAPARPARSPLRPPKLTPGVRPTIYQREPFVHEIAPIPPSPTDRVPTTMPLPDAHATESSTFQLKGAGRTTPTPLSPKSQVSPSSPLRISKVAAPLVPVSVDEIDYDMYKDCLLEGEDWEKEIKTL